MAHGHQADLKIAFYWQMLQWSQEQLRQQVLPCGKRMDFPAMNDPLEELEYEEGIYAVKEIDDDEDEDDNVDMDDQE